MQNIKHIVEHEYKPSFRLDKICGKFDLEPKKTLKKEWDINIDIPEKWNIGLIVGASGSGKTTLAKHIFNKANYHYGYEWGADGFVNDFDNSLNLDDITNALSHVGFSSPPSWLLPFSALSNGQQFRAELARCIIENDDLVVFDEFTSVVDRTVAKASSSAVSKFIRKSGGKFVAVSCHYDIEEWLNPDWVLDVSTGEFYRRSLRRPEIDIEICEVDKKAWGIFREHHYLDHNIHKAAKCYCAFIDGTPVAFTSIINFPSKQGVCVKREHRTVVLPDYQGLGISNALVKRVAKLYHDQGFKVQISTSHPAVIAARAKDSSWIMNGKPCRAPKYSSMLKAKKSYSANRLTASFTFIDRSNKK